MDRGPQINSVLLNPDVFGPEPAPVPCPFCGQMLPYDDMRDSNGEHVCWSAIPVPCTCHGYTRDLEQQNAARERREAAEKKRRENELYEQLISETLFGTGITAGRTGYTLDQYVPRDDMQSAALDQVRQYVQNFSSMRKSGTGLLLSGPNGTGKTHLALACAAELRMSGVSGVLYRTAAEILREMRSAWDQRISETTVMHAYTTLPLLIIDDIGKQFQSPRAQHWMFEIFDGRYSRRLPTILTTNLAPSALADGISTNEDLSSAVVSRLKETMICVPVTGSDYRAQPHADVSQCGKARTA